jgi:pimeloyl-ACP methyl ester carboxylesterase
MAPTDDTSRLFTLQQYLDDFDAGLDTQGLKRSSFLGYSHGGYFVTAYAIAKPERVSALILVEPALFNDQAELRHRAQLAREGRAEESLKAMLSVVEPTVANDAALSTRAARHIMAHVTNDALASELTVRAEHPISHERIASLRMPVLLIGGMKSHVKSITSTLMSLLPHAHVWWVQDATHGDLGANRHDDDLNKIMTMFLEESVPFSEWSGH